MFSSKPSVNTLTSLLISHGIRHAVVCPGSRNAPLVHNFTNCKDITCHPITDERSAAFFALGIILATGSPVAVCVTSGSALLNTASAVSEAYYQHLPLLVISADRPEAWIDQNDGQTIRQPEALKNFVKHSTTLPLVHNDEDHWHCNRLINEALLALRHRGGGPVHINIPIDEPLYRFDVPSLPEERVIRRYTADVFNDIASLPIVESYSDAKRPMIVIGQTNEELVPEYILDELSRHCVILAEPLATGVVSLPFEDALSIIGDDSDYQPDFILYLGGMLVSKRLKQFLRSCKSAEQWRIDEDGSIVDTFMHLTGSIEAKPEHILQYLAFSDHLKKNTFARLWNDIIKETAEEAQNAEPAFSPATAVQYVEEKAGKLLKKRDNIHFHYANSTAVRLACRYSRHHIYCNRGVNGIDGTLSTAAGHSVATSDKVVCVTGDLSFFYDNNALWNSALRGNLRILLLNDGGGAIFKTLPGFPSDAPSTAFISGTHNATAKGICESHNIEYLSAHNLEEMQSAIGTLLTATSDRPIVLECLFES